jgi:hypothetical protein
MGRKPAARIPVSETPTGWVVQDSNPYALVIAPAYGSSTDPDDFLGKLVVSGVQVRVTAEQSRG